MRAGSVGMKPPAMSLTFTREIINELRNNSLTFHRDLEVLYPMAYTVQQGLLLRWTLRPEQSCGRETWMEWTRSETLALAMHQCTQCHGSGLRLGRKSVLGTLQLRVARQFSASVMSASSTARRRRGTSARSRWSPGGPAEPFTWGRKDEEYIADFCLVSRREFRRFRVSDCSVTISCSGRIGSCAAAGWASSGAISSMPSTGSSKNWAAYSANWSRIRCFRWTSISTARRAGDRSAAFAPRQRHPHGLANSALSGRSAA